MKSRASLLVGAERDHPFCNPDGPCSLALSTLLYSQMLIFMVEKNFLRDQGMVFCITKCSRKLTSL